MTRARDRFQVAAPVAGRLERIGLEERDAVGAGDVIARIGPLPLDVRAASHTSARVAAAARQAATARAAQAREAGTPLVQLGDSEGLEAVVDVPSADAVRIPAGAPIRLVEWGDEGAIAARVRRVEPAGFTKVSTLGVEEQRVYVVADLLEAPAALGDGYRVEARIVTWESADVLKVPNSSLVRTGRDWGVFVVENRRARLRDVRLGHRGAAEAEIVEGLAAGDRVILFPSDRLADGARGRAVVR